MKSNAAPIFISLTVIAVLALGFFLFTLLSTDAAGKPYVPSVEWHTADTATPHDGLVVTVGNEIVYTDAMATSTEAAQVACDAVAYNPEHMWKQVICLYNGIEIYNDVFIAG